MNANQKILNILIAEMGTEAVMAICQEHIAASKKVAVTPVQNKVVVPTEPKAPIKIIGKVVIKKPSAPSAVAKNLTADLSAAASTTSTEKELWTCPPCGKGPGNDHRLCVVNAYNCDVAGWETAVGLRKPGPTSEKPTATEKPAAAEVKKVVRVKKPAEVPRCDARIYGEQVEMEGTKAPNGKPLHCFRPAQCERKGNETLAVPEDGQLRHLTDGQTPAEDEGAVHLCKVCLKRWEGRTENAGNWHGFFDDDGAPETSHFIDGAWYKKKMTKVANAADTASDD
jgi:hypothetical protein